MIDFVATIVQGNAEAVRTFILVFGTLVKEKFNKTYEETFLFGEEGGWGEEGRGHKCTQVKNLGEGYSDFCKGRSVFLVAKFKKSIFTVYVYHFNNLILHFRFYMAHLTFDN